MRSHSRIPHLLVPALLLAGAGPLLATEHDIASWSETLPLIGSGGPGGPGAKVTIKNYSGAVTVIGEARSDVSLTVKAVYTADNRELLATAKREVRLERAGGERVLIAAVGPFGDCDWHGQGRHDRDGHDGTAWRGWEREGYRVVFTIEARVPANADLVALTVEDGNVHVSGVDGRLDIENVNGDVLAERVGGQGEFASVNGALRVEFASNPTGPSRFHNVNGDVDVSFRGGFAADALLKTMNGQMWSDFDYRSVALPVEVERDAGRFVYRGNRGTAVRFGAGGPRLEFETLNGDIEIRKRES